MIATAALSKKYITKAVRCLQKSDHDWQVGFCEDCAALRFYPASFTDPGDVDCVAGLDPLDIHCLRHQELFEDERIISEAEEYAAEDDPEILRLDVYIDRMGGGVA